MQQWLKDRDRLVEDGLAFTQTLAAAKRVPIETQTQEPPKAVDLAQIYGAPPLTSTQSRLPSEDFARMSEALAQVGLHLRHPEDAEARLAEIRLIYEPFVNALSSHLLVTLPPWITTTRTVDDWQTSAWDHFAQWSPEKIEEITHIIVDQRKKGPVHATEPRDQAGPSTLA